MDINNIPDKVYKEITDKDGTKIVFDFNLGKTKEAYIKLQNKYNELKENKEKKKPFKIFLNILFCTFFIFGIIAFFNSYLLLSLLLLVIALIIISYTDRDVNMPHLDIMEILELEDEMEFISEISTLDESYISKINIDDNNDIDFLYVDEYEIPHTIQITLKNNLYRRTDIHYRNIDYIYIINNVYSLNIFLPLKYSDTYRELIY